jgi:hypothetical protein
VEQSWGNGQKVTGILKEEYDVQGGTALLCNSRIVSLRRVSSSSSFSPDGNAFANSSEGRCIA